MKKRNINKTKYQIKHWYKKNKDQVHFYMFSGIGIAIFLILMGVLEGREIADCINNGRCV